MRRAALVAVGTLLLVLAGCGSGTRLSQSEFDAKVRTICAEYTKRAQKELVFSDIDPTSTEATALDVARFSRTIEHTATIFGEQLDDLRAVRPPAMSAARYSQVLELYGEIESALVRAARAARKGDRRGLAALGRELSAATQTVDALGFRCE